MTTWTKSYPFITKLLTILEKLLRNWNLMNIYFWRPTDYYAEMVKSDHHMENARDGFWQEKKKNLGSRGEKEG